MLPRDGGSKPLPQILRFDPYDLSPPTRQPTHDPSAPYRQVQAGATRTQIDGAPTPAASPAHGRGHLAVGTPAHAQQLGLGSSLATASAHSYRFGH